MSTSPVASLRDVVFRHPGAERPALDGVSLDFGSGRVHWLYGRLGAGCSTLLQVVAGLAPGHTGGELAGGVEVLGRDPRELRARRALAGRIAYATAVPGLQLSGVAATVFEEVAFAPANLGWPIERIRAAAAAALARFGVAHLAGRDPTTLSGGELQRVVLASMLALSPDLWLADEPASELDPAGRLLCYEVLREEAARGAAVVVASEDADGLVETAHRLVILAEGRVVADGAPRDLLAGDAVWTEGPGSTSVAALARAARAHADAPSLEPPHPLTVADGLVRWGGPVRTR
jgi:energy-coupling factor transporter ATP-binding protein EcfA2